jgi:hypothetical protein
MADSKSTAISDRVARARRLVEQGRVKRCGDAHIVNNGKGTGYTVWRDQEGCSCPAGRSGMQCYHRVAVEVFESRSRIARQKTQEMPKRDSLRGVVVNWNQLDQVAARLGV